MATPYLFLFLIFIFFPQKINSSSCSLEFSRFPYEANAECLDIATNSPSSVASLSCCRSALFSLFQAMAIRSNRSRSIFLDPAEAQECVNSFKSLHNRTSLSMCELQKFVSPSVDNSCSKDIDSVINLLGVENFNAFKSNCSALSSPNHRDDACLNCVIPYRQSLRSLREFDSKNGKGCGEALLLSLASASIDPPQWIHGTFSCLWNEIEVSPYDKRKQNGFLMGSKKLVAIMVVAAALVVLAPILYVLTKKSLQEKSDEEMKNLSGSPSLTKCYYSNSYFFLKSKLFKKGPSLYQPYIDIPYYCQFIVFKKTLEDDIKSPFNCSDLYLFSQDEIMKATKGFDDANLIREGNLGNAYVGTMPSGMRAEILRIREGIEIRHFIDEICVKTKIRHPNLVSVMGYCNKGEQCLVSDYCVNGDLASWLLGERRKVVLAWEQRVVISIGIARGLWFLHNNTLEKMVHGDIKSGNIFLNENLQPKVWLCILSSNKLKEKGGAETMASDVFSFGVVLLQLLTGRKPKSLVDEVRDAIVKGGNLSAMADPNLKQEFVSTEFRHMLSVALVCTAPTEIDRPNMGEILHKLEKM